jgi:hypothetical protein
LRCPFDDIRCGYTARLVTSGEGGLRFLLDDLKSRPGSLAHAFFRPDGCPRDARRALQPSHPRRFLTVYCLGAHVPAFNHLRRGHYGHRQHHPGERRHDRTTGNPGPLDIGRRGVDVTEAQPRKINRGSLAAGVG